MTTVFIFLPGLRRLTTPTRPRDRSFWDLPANCWGSEWATQLQAFDRHSVRLANDLALLFPRAVADGHRPNFPRIERARSRARSNTDPANAAPTNGRTD